MLVRQCFAVAAAISRALADGTYSVDARTGLAGVSNKANCCIFSINWHHDIGKKIPRYWQSACCWRRTLQQSMFLWLVNSAARMAFTGSSYSYAMEFIAM